MHVLDRHGFARTECHVLYDQTLAFHDIVMERMANDMATNNAANNGKITLHMC